MRFQAQPIDEFTPSQAFETGKLAMNFDGEWRVAFIHDEHPNLDYGTAPMPVDDAHPELYGSGYINGTIIGIPRGVKHQDAGVGAREVPDDERPSAGRPVERAAQRPDDEELAELEGDHAGRALLDVPEDLRQPEVGHVPILASGQAYTNSVQNFFTKWQAGKRQEPRRRAEEAREATRRPGRPGQGRRRGAVSRERFAGDRGGRPAGRPASAAHGARGGGPTGAAAGSCCS